MTRCHCYPVLRCAEPASAEVEAPDTGDWRPVCERCMQIAWEALLRVRKHVERAAA